MAEIIDFRTARHWRKIPPGEQVIWLRRFPWLGPAGIVRLFIRLGRAKQRQGRVKGDGDGKITW
jgi:hypothetical protein